MTLITIKRSTKHYSCLPVFLIVFSAFPSYLAFAATDLPGGGPAPVQADTIRLNIPFQISNLREEVRSVIVICQIGRPGGGPGLIQNPVNALLSSINSRLFSVDEQGRASGTAQITITATPRHRAETNPKFSFSPTHYRCFLKGKLKDGILHANESCSINSNAYPECKNTGGSGHTTGILPIP